MTLSYDTEKETGGDIRFRLTCDEDGCAVEFVRWGSWHPDNHHAAMQLGWKETRGDHGLRIFLCPDHSSKAPERID